MNRFALISAALVAGRSAEAQTTPPESTLLYRVYSTAGLAGQRSFAPEVGAATPVAFGATFVSGLTEFLLERARAEVVHSVFADIHGWMSDKRDLRILFPTVRSTVAAVDELNYRMILPALRSAAEDDLRQLPVRFVDPELTFWPKAGVPWQAQTVSIAARRGFEIADGMPALVSLSALADLREEDLSQDTVRAVLQLAGQLAREALAVRGAPSTKDPDFEKWLGDRREATLATVLSDQRTRTLFFGLLLRGIPDSAVRAQIDTAPLTRVLALYRQIQQMEDLAGQDSPDAKPTLLDILHVAAKALRTVAEQVTDPEVRGAFDRATGAADALYAAFAERDYTRLVLVVVTALPDSGGEERQRIVRILTLAGALASAKDAEKANEALAAWADPVGSFRERRRPRWSTALVGYVGLAGGRERLDQVKSATPTGWYSGGLGLVGIEVARGSGSGSVGILVSVLDVGTLLSYRLSDRVVADSVDSAEVSALPDYGMTHVFSPGLWLTFGLTARYPLTLGAGVQFAPRLREVDAQPPVRERNALRVGVFVAIDLTLFQF